LKVGDTITFTDGEGNTITGTINDNGEVEANDKIYSEVHRDLQGNYVTKETGT
jgi:hypothetical protein